MKKALALIIALMILLLAACGQEPARTEQETTANTQKAQENTAPASENPEQGANSETEGYHVEEGVLEDGTKYTIYRNGGPEGIPVQIVYETPGGGYGEDIFDSEGNLERSIFDEPDGTHMETYFYPSGNISKDIMRMPDGSWQEVHYMDDGILDEATGWITSGTICYEKYVSADGQVEEYTYDITKEEDGSYWMNETWDDGTVVDTHYSAEGIRIKQVMQYADGTYSETDYYESGVEKRNVRENAETGERWEIEYYELTKTRVDETTGDSFEMSIQKKYVYENSTNGGYILYEYYESGKEQHSISITLDGSKMERLCDEEGNITYQYENFSTETEYFGEGGVLVKYIEGGTTYEGPQIPSYAKSNFDNMQKSHKETEELIGN